MKYLVMETHPAYAVVLDERGRFLKAANLHYQVGETVEDVVELRLPSARRRLRPAWGVVGALAAAACLCLGFFGYWAAQLCPLRHPAHPDQPRRGAVGQQDRPRAGPAGASTPTARPCWRAWT